MPEWSVIYRRRKIYRTFIKSVNIKNWFIDMTKSVRQFIHLITSSQCNVHHVNKSIYKPFSQPTRI